MLKKRWPIQSTFEIRTIQISNGHFPDAFWVWFSNALAAILHSKTGPDASLDASLGRFDMNKIFIIKWSRLVFSIRKLDKFDNRPKNDHSKTGTVPFMDFDCTLNTGVHFVYFSNGSGIPMSGFQISNVQKCIKNIYDISLKDLCVNYLEILFLIISILACFITNTKTSYVKIFICIC
jgi:hypothetical protein